jgi:hypothetical protein
MTSWRSIQNIHDKYDFNIDVRINKIINKNKRILNAYEFHNIFHQLRGKNKEARDNNMSKIKVNNLSLIEIYNKYVQQYNVQHPKKKRRNPIDEVVRIDEIDDYPFKSKLKYFDDDLENNKPPDYKLDTFKRLMRPYFSPTLGSWELDVVYYLFCININTKYLVVYKLKSMRNPVIVEAINDLVENYYVSNLKGDGQFRSIKIDDVKIFTNSSPFVNHNRVVDRVIRTVRDAIGPSFNDFSNYEKIKKVVDYYNFTPHNSLRLEGITFTPYEVQNNKDLEGIFIRRSKEILELVEEEQEKEGLKKFTKGDILMIHLNYSKTPLDFMKKRRNFKALAQFVEYVNGNCRVKVLNPIEMIESKNNENENDKSNELNLKRVIDIPIYHCKFVSNSLKDIPQNFRNYFL